MSLDDPHHRERGEHDPADRGDALRYWSDRRLVDAYRRLSHDLRRRDCDQRTIHRMGRVEEELRDRDLDPGRIAREVDRSHRSDRS